MSPVSESIELEPTKKQPSLLPSMAPTVKNEVGRVFDDSKMGRMQMEGGFPGAAALYNNPGLFLNAAAFFGNPLANYMMLQKPVIRPPDIPAAPSTPPASQSSSRTAAEESITQFWRNTTHVAIAFIIQRNKKAATQANV
jgi:hypothetical protein